MNSLAGAGSAGEAGGRQGEPNAGDGHGVFTRGILAANGTSYLFFEGVLNPMTPDTPMGRSAIPGWRSESQDPSLRFLLSGIGWMSGGGPISPGDSAAGPLGTHQEFDQIAGRSKLKDLRQKNSSIMKCFGLPLGGWLTSSR